MIRKTIELLGGKFAVTPADTFGFDSLKAGPMRFTVERYAVAGVGNLSVMQASGMFGLMKMDTVILTPLAKDAPLFSYDRIHAMGNDTLIVELYDTMLGPVGLDSFDAVRARYSELPEHDTGSHWYDPIRLPQSAAKKGRKQSDKFDALYLDMLGAYIDVLADAPVCDKAEKSAKSAVYVDGLLTHGGPSTDVFVKAIGKDSTRKLFEQVLFGIK